jgi:hypothetical protein
MQGLRRISRSIVSRATRPHTAQQSVASTSLVVARRLTGNLPHCPRTLAGRKGWTQYCLSSQHKLSTGRAGSVHLEMGS